jgi:predicted phosphodiesterase
MNRPDTGPCAVDLGTVTEPVLFFGGPYSNLQATEALLGEARRLGLPPDRVICTGDVIAYGGDAVATTEMIVDSGVHVVMGNCEESVGFEAGNCGCGFEPGSSCDTLSAQWFAYVASHLGEPHRAWMRGLPRRIDLTLGGIELAVIHAGADDISQFVFGSMNAAEAGYQISRLSTDRHVDGVVGGHCGLPFTCRSEAHLWHNPGAIGMPANDGTPRA